MNILFSNPQQNSSSVDLMKSKQHFVNCCYRDESDFARVIEKAQHYIEQAQSVFSKFQFKNYIHVGIGGSSLGPEMLYQALRDKHTPMMIFINNVDSDELNYQLDQVNLKESLIHVVSKSGKTVETMAAMNILARRLKELGIEEKDFPKHFLFSTDPTSGELRKLSVELGIHALEIPPALGGRYSVHSSVGIIPLLVMKKNPSAFFEGAKSFLTNDTKLKNDFFKLYHTILEGKEIHSHKQTVLMPYSSRLAKLSMWFVQLWAESLGKKLNSQGKVVNTGLTPICSYGVTDQHSQVQLFVEGPYDKFFIFIEVENFNKNFSLNGPMSSELLNRLSQFNLNQLMKAEFEGTLKAFQESSRPYSIIRIEEVNEFNIGSLIMLFETLTAMVGRSMGINPFDQPGVEAGKTFAWQWLEQNSN